MAEYPVDRTVVVTGAVSPRGIGRYTAGYLAERGWNVAIVDLDQSGCEALAAELVQAYGVSAVGVGADISDPVAVSRAVDIFEAELPQIVALANIAGISSPTSYLDVPIDEWRRVLSIDLDGVHVITQRVAKVMVAHGVGRIVSISSVSAQRGGGTFSKAAYSAAKAGVIGLTRAVARELGAYGVTANAISPGPIDTDIMGGTLSEERKQELVQDLVTDRIGTPRDVAAAIAFLISEDASFITGQTLNVDGGLYMH
ncbi:MAG: hypothetical protein QOF79_2114 [Actinomycetota bacterium]|nr:hypothetical protein [Actinomycetota bacterium]